MSKALSLVLRSYFFHIGQGKFREVGDYFIGIYSITFIVHVIQPGTVLGTEKQEHKLVPSALELFLAPGRKELMQTNTH